jgi:lipid-binding SYLF domain-containing protein
MNGSKMNFHPGAVLVLLALALAPVSLASADSAAQIDAAVEDTIADLRASKDNVDELLATAKGVLVIPNVRKLAFMVGGEWGTGAFLVNDKTVGYYKMNIGSAGLQAGYHESDFVFIFLTQDAVDKFLQKDSFEFGVGGGLAVVEFAPGFDLNTLKGEAEVVGFNIGKEGLSLGWSARGASFKRADPR